VKPRAVELPERRVWLRVADAEWDDPLDATYAKRFGGRWNPPESFRTLYLNADPETARLRLEAMLRGSPIRVDDLDDDAYVLVAATLPRNQTCAEAQSDAGLKGLDLPSTYPTDGEGSEVPRSVCQTIGRAVHDRSLRGVSCRSASTSDGRGRELAWYPATTRSHAHAVWNLPLRLGAWRNASTWGQLRLPRQRGLGLRAEAAGSP
jgi:hypothetical protein